MAEHHEEHKSDSFIEKITEKIHAHDSSSSSDSDDDKPSASSLKSKVFRLFGREKPVHKVLGGGKPDDIDEAAILRGCYDYEPPFFRGCTEEEARNQWTKNPLKTKVGNVKSKHFVLALKVKSVLDPCEDDDEENQDESVSLGADSTRKDDGSESGNEVCLLFAA